MLTREEYEKTLIRMFDSIRTDDDYKGELSCRGISCEGCPFCDKECHMSNAFKAIEIVEKWGIEHPVMTKEDKFEEVFGHRPLDVNGHYCCPKSLGWYKIEDCFILCCKDCEKIFWKSEYIPPKKER